MMQQQAGAAETRALVNRPGATTDQHRETEPGKKVIELKVVAGNGIEPAVALSASERSALEACEGILERGLGTFFEVGNALLTICDSRLYRDSRSNASRSLRCCAAEDAGGKGVRLEQTSSESAAGRVPQAKVL